jgi:hypothetical protein
MDLLYQQIRFISAKFDLHRGAAHSDHITVYANQKLENYKTHV